MVHCTTLYCSLMEQIRDQEVLLLNSQAKQLAPNERIVFQNLSTLGQQKRMLDIGEKGRFLVFMITLPTTKAYEIFFSMSRQHQDAFLTFGKMNTSLEFIQLTPHEKNLFIELPNEIRHQAAIILNRAAYDRIQKNASDQLIYSAVMTPEQIIYNFKMYGSNASKYETKYIQHNDSAQHFEIKKCESCGFTIHHSFEEKPLHCMNCKHYSKI